MENEKSLPPPPILQAKCLRTFLHGAKGGFGALDDGREQSRP